MKSHKLPAPRRLSAKPLLLSIALVLGLATAGCVSRPQVIYERDGSISSYKRYERHGERDFIHRFTRRAYRLPRPDFYGRSDDQRVILEQWGDPDYVRKTFRSFEGERVAEWVYLDKRRVIQFVKHAIVYEGELTDLEQIMLHNGYPDRLVTIIGESRHVHQTMIYNSIFTADRLDEYHLTDGWINQLTIGD